MYKKVSDCFICSISVMNFFKKLMCISVSTADHDMCQDNSQNEVEEGVKKFLARRGVSWHQERGKLYPDLSVFYEEANEEEKRKLFFCRAMITFMARRGVSWPRRRRSRWSS